MRILGVNGSELVYWLHEESARKRSRLGLERFIVSP